MEQDTRARAGGAMLADPLTGHLLDGRYRIVAVALAEGRVNVAQAHVTVNALEDLPSDLDPELRLQGEAHLVEQAAQFGPRELRRLGDRLLEAIAPDIADQAEYDQGGPARR